MSNTYRPVVAHTFVNTYTDRFYTVKVSLHNIPTVTTFFGKIGKGGKTKKFFAESRDAAREYAENKIESKIEDGYVEVA